MYPHFPQDLAGASNHWYAMFLCVGAHLLASLPPYVHMLQKISTSPRRIVVESDEI